MVGHEHITSPPRSEANTRAWHGITSIIEEMYSYKNSRASKVVEAGRAVLRAIEKDDQSEAAAIPGVQSVIARHVVSDLDTLLEYEGQLRTVSADLFNGSIDAVEGLTFNRSVFRNDELYDDIGPHAQAMRTIANRTGVRVTIWATSMQDESRKFQQSVLPETMQATPAQV